MSKPGMHLRTEQWAHGCFTCKKIIPSGARHYYDPATRRSFHEGCEPKPQANKAQPETTQAAK